VQLRLKVYGLYYEEHASGNGQYDSFMKALKRIYKRLGKALPKLTDFNVSIPPGGKTDAFVETIITWEFGKKFKTKGLDSDQTVAAMKATEKMLNIIEQMEQTKTVKSKIYGNENSIIGG